MKRNDQKVPGYDEIIFENRNKIYGAYDLRKRYKSAVGLSLFGGITIFSLPFILTFFFAPEPVTAKPETGNFVVVKTDNLIDPDKITQPLPLKREPAAPKFRYMEPKVVEDSMDVTNLMITDFVKDSVINEIVTDNIDSISYSPPVTDVTEEEEPLTFVQEEPVFPGGEAALLRYIAQNIRYPEAAIENNLQGKVFIKFVVSADGSVKRAEILRGLDPMLDEEALRVVSTLPAWKPGKQNGKAVPVWFIVLVSFQIQTN
jgi:protein TonB